MQKKFSIILIFFLIFLPKILYSSEVKIVLKVNNEIITNVDIENEIKYLKIVNSNLSKLNTTELNELSKNSLIRQIIKKEEVSKYFDVKSKKNLGENLIKNKLTSFGFKNKSEYLAFLKTQNLDNEVFEEKIVTENLWNSLIFQKFKDNIKINENELREKIKILKKKQDKTFEFNLSEILINYNTDYEDLNNFIKEFGFESAANKFSISDTSNIGGKIGWVNSNNLSEIIKTKIFSLKKGGITKPIEISNGMLILKLNSKREIKSQFNVNEELKRQINYEKNRQLNAFSINYYKKLKQNSLINEY